MEPLKIPIINIIFFNCCTMIFSDRQFWLNYSQIQRHVWKRISVWYFDIKPINELKLWRHVLYCTVLCLCRLPGVDYTFPQDFILTGHVDPGLHVQRQPLIPHFWDQSTTWQEGLSHPAISFLGLKLLLLSESCNAHLSDKRLKTYYKLVLRDITIH